MIKKITMTFVALLATLSFVGCSSSVEKLDMKAYLALRGDNAVYPSAEQIEMLSGIIPKETYMPMAPISDRSYWESMASSPEGTAYIADAYALIEKEPEVPITDEIYRRANKEGNRGIYKPRYYRTMDCLEHFILAECMENKGNFIAQIENHAEAIMSMKSWLHPNHDDAQNTVLEGKRMSIDLGARKFGLVLSLAEITLEDRITPELRTKIKSEIKRRITDSYLDSCPQENPKSNNWIRSTSNWNSVCTSGSIFSIITSSQSLEERTVAIGSAINSMVYYMSGFGDDGYCSEGTGYWGYGFGHYLYLAEILYDYTDGKIDLFEFNDAEKLKRVAAFPKEFQIHTGYYAPFSDGVTSVATDSDNFAYLMSAKYYGADKPSKFQTDESVTTVIGWRSMDEFIDKSGAVSKLPDVTYFDHFGIVISRGLYQTPFSVAIKAGHNAENHNHSDVGSYYILIDNEPVAGDIGAPSYTAGAFDKDNPARSSWGHPVPRVAGQLQSNGIEFCGSVTSTSFTDEEDVAKLDLKAAYEVEQLEKLERTMSNKRVEGGQITISDEFKASSPIEFGTAIMVNVDYTIKGNTITLNTGSHTVAIEVEADGGEIKLTDEWVPVEHLRTGRKSYRIGVDFTKPLAEGKISVKYTAIN